MDVSWASYYNNLSLLYQEMKRFDLAKESLLKSLEFVLTKPNAIFEQAVTYTNLANTCLALGQGEALALGLCLGLLCGLGLFKQHEQAEQDAADGDVDVGNIEDGEGHELKLEHINHIAADHAVDAVAHGAGHDHNGHPAGKGGVDNVLDQHIDYQCHESDAQDNEEPSGTLQNGEGSAGVVDVGQVDKTGDELAGALVEDDVGGGPILYGLIDDKGDDGHDCVQHRVYLLGEYL